MYQTVLLIIKLQQPVYCPPLSRKHGDIKSHSSLCLSVCLSVCHKNFNLGHNFCTITDRAFILGMCVPCDKTFPVIPCRDLDGDLWPSSRSNLLPSGGPQLSEFACLLLFRLGRKSGITIRLDQSRDDRTWDYVRSVSFMYGSLRRTLWDEKNKMADNVHVDIESSGDQFMLRLYND